MFFSRSLVYYFLIVLLLAGGCSGKKEESGSRNAPKSPMVGGVIVQPSEMVNRIVSTGTVMANEEVELRSELPGRIVSISFDEGSQVEKGQVLVKIDDRELQAQLRKMQVEEKQSADDLYRKEKLFALKAISQEELDQAQNALNIIRAQIELIRTQISKTEILAPFHGKIGLRQVSPGGFISSSTLVARLQQTNPVKVDFSVPEKYQEKIRPGARIDFRVEGRDSLFSGTIYAIEPRVDPATRNIQIRAKCENSRGLLIPGAFARVEVTLDRFEQALVIPSEAVIPQLGSEKVLVCQGGKVVSKSVLTGIRTEREVQVLQGIESGDTVITTGLLQLREGSPVKVKIQP